MRENKQIGTMASTKTVNILLNILWYLGWLACGLVLLIAAVILVTDHNVKYVNLPIKVSFENSDDFRALASLNKYNELDIVGFEMIKVDVSKGDHIGIEILIPLVLILAYLWVVMELRKFIKTVKEGRPFTTENSRRIRMIGFIVMIAGPVVGALNYIYGLKYLSQIDIPGAEIDLDPDLYPLAIVLGLLIIVVGHVYDIGVKLQTEQDLTV